MKEKTNNLQKKRTNPYTQVANEILNDRELSLKAKGLYAFMYSKPENWNFTAASMATQLKESRKAILGMLAELKNRGIVSYQKNSNGTGKYILDDAIPESQNDTLGQNSQSPKMTPCQNDTVPKEDCINNKYSNNKNNLNNNPIGQGLVEKTKVKLNLSVKAAEFRQKFIANGYIGRLAPVMIEGEKEDVYINDQGRLYTLTRTDRQIVSSTLNEIWEQLSEINETRSQKPTHDPLKNLNINRIEA